MDHVVVAGKHRLTGQATPHDRRDVVGALEAEGGADLDHGLTEKFAAILARPPVDTGIQDRRRDAVNVTEQAGCVPGPRPDDPHVTRRHDDAGVRRLDEPDAHHPAETLEDLADPLLLRLGDRVLERIALRIGAVVGAEVVKLDGHGFAEEPRELTMEGVGIGGAVARFVDRSDRRGKTEIPQRRRYLQAILDLAVHSGSGAREHAEIAGGREARIFIAPLGARGRRRHEGGGGTDLQAIQPVVGEGTGRERQRGLAAGRVVHHTRRIDRREGGDVEAGPPIHLEQSIGRRLLGRCRVQGIVLVEIHGDLAAILRERSTDPGDRLRHHRHDERAEIEPDVERARGSHRVTRHRLQAGRAAPDRDPIRVVGQRVGEAHDDLVAIGHVVDRDAPRHDRHVIGVAERVAAAAAAHDRNAAERRRIEGDARAEPQRELLRRLAKRLRDLPRHEKRPVVRHVGRHEVERHHAAVFEPFQRLRLMPLGPAARDPSALPTPTIKQLLDGRRPLRNHDVTWIPVRCLRTPPCTACFTHPDRQPF